MEMKVDANKIDTPNLLNFEIPVLITMYPSTPEWTDRSWNGKGFFPLDIPEVETIDTEKMEDTKYKRHYRRS
jgi:hypothetical protein